MGEAIQYQFKGTGPTGPDAPPAPPSPAEALALAAGDTKPVTAPAEPPVQPEVKPEVKPEAKPEVKPETPPAPVELTEAEIEKYSNEVTEKGDLSEESQKALEARGIPRWLQARTVRSFQAEQAANVAAIQAEAGGAEGYTKMAEWAKKNIPADEREAFDKTLRSGDIAATKIAVRGIYAKYTAENGTNPGRVEGRATIAGPAPFRSQQEMVDAMRNPKYHTNPEYREDVLKRVAVSNI